MPQTIMVSQLMEMLESVGLQEEWQWRWNKLRELIDAAEQKFALDGAVCTCKIMSSVIGDNHAEDCALHYPPRQ